MSQTPRAANGVDLTLRFRVQGRHLPATIAKATELLDALRLLLDERLKSGEIALVNPTPQIDVVWSADDPLD